MADQQNRGGQKQGQNNPQAPQAPQAHQTVGAKPERPQPGQPGGPKPSAGKTRHPKSDQKQ